MPLEAPDLDVRTYDDIVAEATALIPRYTPEWTDHNESDPGITLVQLFAWMTESLLYGLNQVPERHYLKFLQLLGIELEAAEPAQVELSFTLTAMADESVIVPRRTRVAAADPSSTEPLVFETDRALIAVRARLAAVQVFDGSAYAVETTTNDTAGQWFHPFGSQAGDGSALVLGLGPSNPFAGDQLDLAVWAAEGAAEGAAEPAAGACGSAPPAAAVVWEHWRPSRQRWESLTVDEDGSRAFTRSGHVLIRGPEAAPERDRLGEVEDHLYWIRARLVRGGYDAAPRLDEIATNTVPSTQARTVAGEVLGGSDGRPSQEYRLASAPVVRDSLRLEIDEGEGFETWEEVADFDSSTPTDRHYVLNRTLGAVTVGDGRRGRIPKLNRSNPLANVVARWYRFGGGTRGNVPAGRVTGLETAIDGVDSVVNKRAAQGGADEESIEHAKSRAPGALKSKGRAVTSEDFEALALATPGVRVRRAKALPMLHPGFPGTEIPGVVSLIVVPDGSGPRPTPGEATLRAVCAQLDASRLLTCEVHVLAPAYHKICVQADVIVAADGDLAEVAQSVEGRLRDYFHPLWGGEDGAGWEFGREISYSRVARQLEGVAGVARIEDAGLFLFLDGDREPFCRDVPIEPNSLLYSNGHDIRVRYGGAA
jgi:hypothetical protein